MAEVEASTSRRPVAVAVYTIHPEVEESQAEPWAGESRSFRLLGFRYQGFDCNYFSLSDSRLSAATRGNTVKASERVTAVTIGITIAIALPSSVMLTNFQRK